MASFDIFKDSAFSVVEMTRGVNKIPYIPQYLESLNIFTPEPIRTESFFVEKIENTLSLIKSDERGSARAQEVKDRRDIRDFRTVRLRREDVIKASEIANIRAFNTESELKQMTAEIASRQQKIDRNMQLTEENMRLGAIAGVVLDADGSTIYDWYDQWGIAQPAEVAFDSANATMENSKIKKACSKIYRAMWKQSKGSFTPQTQIFGLAGDDFFDDLTGNAETNGSFKTQQATNDLRPDYAKPFDTFRYGQITFVNYRGTDDNAVGVHTDKCRFFPVGAIDVFSHVLSPGEGWDVVNLKGQRRYSKVIPDRDYQEWVKVDLASYPMFFCKRPEVLQRARRGA